MRWTIRDDALKELQMTISEVVDGAVQLSTLASDAANVPDPAMTVSRVTDLAAKLIPCAAADVVRVTHAGELRIVASSDAGLSDLTIAVWQRWPHYPLSSAVQGPCRAHNHGSGYSPEPRAECGIAGELLFALQIGTSDHGFLRFLFQDAVSASSPLGRLAAAFAVQAVIAIDRAALQTKVGNLLVAIDTNRDIGGAVGIVMAQHNLDYQGAYLLLRSVSQDDNRKLRDVVAEVLTSRCLTRQPKPNDPGTKTIPPTKTATRRRRNLTTRHHRVNSCWRRSPPLRHPAYDESVPGPDTFPSWAETSDFPLHTSRHRRTAATRT